MFVATRKNRGKRKLHTNYGQGEVVTNSRLSDCKLNKFESGTTSIVHILNYTQIV